MVFGVWFLICLFVCFKPKSPTDVLMRNPFKRRLFQIVCLGVRFLC